MSGPERGMGADPHDGSGEPPREPVASVGPDGADINATDFLQRWKPDGPWILGARPDGGSMHCREFTDLAAAGRWIDEQQARKANCYFEPNDCRLGPNGKPGRDDVLRATCLHVDVDPRPGKPLAEEQARIDAHVAELVKEGVIPEPTVCIDSGGGRQLFWKQDQPVEFASDEQRHEFERYNKHLCALLGGDKCHNVDRLMRLPGTTNFPSADKKARNPGREDAPARVMSATWEAHPLDEFVPAEEKAGAGGANRDRGASTPLPGDGELKQVPVDLDPYVEHMHPAAVTFVHHGCEVKVLRRCVAEGDLGRDHTHKIHGWITSGSRNEAQHWATKVMLEAGVPADMVFSVLIDDAYGISRAIKTKDGKARPQWKRYARTRVKDAWAEIQQPDGDEFHVSEQGKPLPSPHNFRLAVKKLGGALRYNQFSGKVEIDGIDDHGPLMQDRTLEYLAIHIEERFGIACGMERLKVITNEAAYRNSYNPVLDYFESLEWDGVSRLDRWLVTYGAAEDSEYVRAVSPLPLLAAVKRQYEPGAKFDELLTMISDQGFEKSSALRVLAIREEWFCEDLALDSDPKVAIEQTRGKLIVEIAELKGQRASPAKVKSFLSKQKDQARGAWGRYTEEVLRRWVPFATTNEAAYLEDATGNRRHWPVETGRFDLQRLRADLDQLWAEAVHRVKAGASIRLDPKYWHAAGKEQGARRADCAIRDRLETILDGYEDHFVETAALWCALGVTSATDQGRSSTRLADAMTVLGWKKPTTRPLIAGRRRSGWRKGKGARLLGVGSLSEQIVEVHEERMR